MGLLEELFGTPKKRRRKSKGAKMRQRGREAYKSGLRYERDVKKLLVRKGYKPITGRYRPTGAEVDLIVKDREGKLMAVEAKNVRKPIQPSVVGKFAKKIKMSGGYVRGGILVARKGATEKAKKAAKKSGIKIIKYGGAKKKKKSSWPW